MIMNDKQEFEKAEAKNAVEEYVYDMRGKLYEKFEKFITEEVSIRETVFSLVRGCPYKTSAVRRSCPLLTFCGQGGGGGYPSADVRTFCFKNIGVFKIYGVSARTRRREVEPMRTRGRGQFFAILCGRPFGRLLTLICEYKIVNDPRF